MYSLELRSGLTVRFLTFDTYTAATCCMAAFIEKDPGSYIKHYFIGGTLSKTARGHIVGKPIETDILLDFLHETVDF